MTLSGAKKFSVGHHYLTCVFVSLLGIISIGKNKQKGFTTLQSRSRVTNVRRRWFFNFHTHPVRNTRECCNHQNDSILQKTHHFELCVAVKFFWGMYRPSTRIVVPSYIFKTSQKNFGVITMKTSRWRRKKPPPPLKLDFWNPSLYIRSWVSIPPPNLQPTQLTCN